LLQAPPPHGRRPGRHLGRRSRVATAAVLALSAASSAVATAVFLPPLSLYVLVISVWLWQLGLALDAGVDVLQNKM
jgi:hypothetical protein